MNCQMFSWPLSSGARGGSGTSEILFGTTSALAMPASLIKEDNGVRSEGDFGCDLVEMELHGFAVASRQHEGGAGSTSGTGSTKQIRAPRTMPVRRVMATNTKPLSGCLSRDSRIDRGMIQDGKLRGFAMSQAIPVRTNYTAGEVRRFAQRAKDAAQARRLLAIAAVLDGASREEAATIGGMDRQTLRDWVIRFNEQGPDGLINIPSPGVPPKLNSRHKAFLARIVDEGPIPAIHGVVR